jgi:hypothetical protein
MAISAVNATLERRTEDTKRAARRTAFPTFRSLRHGAPAATYSERNRGADAVSRSDAGRLLFETWGWG